MKQAVRCLPSSFLRTRSTAPEHPPQVIVTLNLYWWSDMVGKIDLCWCGVLLLERRGRRCLAGSHSGLFEVFEVFEVVSDK